MAEQRLAHDLYRGGHVGSVRRQRDRANGLVHLATADVLVKEEFSSGVDAESDQANVDGIGRNVQLFYDVLQEVQFCLPVGGIAD